jgi:hypothetical protein
MLAGAGDGRRLTCPGSARTGERQQPQVQFDIDPGDCHGNSMTESSWGHAA